MRDRLVPPRQILRDARDEFRIRRRHDLHRHAAAADRPALVDEPPVLVADLLVRAVPREPIGVLHRETVARRQRPARRQPRQHHPTAHGPFGNLHLGLARMAAAQQRTPPDLGIGIVPHSVPKRQNGDFLARGGLEAQCGRVESVFHRAPFPPSGLDPVRRGAEKPRQEDVGQHLARRIARQADLEDQRLRKALTPRQLEPVVADLRRRGSILRLQDDAAERHLVAG